MAQNKHVQDLLSEYREGSLTPEKRQEVRDHLARCLTCADAEKELRLTVSFLNDLPMPEPKLDLWAEFAPKMAAVEEEMRLKPVVRLHRWWSAAMARIAEGLVLYTHMVAHRTLVRMERYLIRDPFRLPDQF